MVTFKLKGREIPLIYTVCEMKQVQEEIAPLGDFQYVLTGRNKDNPDDTSQYAGPEHLAAVAKLVRILGNAGLEESGENPDLTDRKVMRAMRPMQVADAVSACMDAINEGMASEIPDKEPENGEPVDVTLEEMRTKKEKAG